MKNLFKIVIVLVAVGLLYNYRAPVLDQVSPILSDISDFLRGVEPCEEPLPYTLGSFSAEFKISQEYFLSALADAEAIWEKPYGKELFSYTKDVSSYRTLKVNLIHDYRQQATTKLSQLDIVVDNNRASYENLKDRLDLLRTEYDTKKSTLNSQVNNFNKKQEAYANDVKYWNDRGGAPQAEYTKLRQTQRDLEIEAQALKALENSVNRLAEEINAIIVALNKLIGSLNLSVDKYNTVSEARGESFEEGVYHTDGRNAEIDIYEFSSRAKLVRVLAHELGHALGLDHIEDPKAIMYRLNEGNAAVLSPADIEALKALCNQS